MNFELACLEDFNEIENLYWDLIDKSKEEPSFPDWEKGVHPSADFLMAGIVQKELFVLRDEGIIKACAIVNSNSNKEYKRVAWKVNERDNNVWIIFSAINLRTTTRDQFPLEIFVFGESIPVLIG